MNNKCYNTSFNFAQKAKKYISYNKYCLIIFCLIFIVALITGIFTGIKGSDNISISNINDKILLKFFKRDCGPFSFFASRIFIYILTLIFIFFCGKIKCGRVILGCFLAYMSYSLGLNSAVFMVLLGVGGVASAIIVIIPIKTCVLGVYTICSCISIKNSLLIKKYGYCCFDSKKLLSWLWFLAILFLITIAETILINMFCSAFIFDF